MAVIPSDVYDVGVLDRLFGLSLLINTAVVCSSCLFESCCGPSSDSHALDGQHQALSQFIGVFKIAC